MKWSPSTRRSPRNSNASPRSSARKARSPSAGGSKNARGGWDSAIRSVNELIDDMVQPTAEVSRVIGAVAKGDLSQTMTVEIDGRPLRGEFLRIGKVVNTMVEQLAPLRLRSDPRGPRSGHRRQARRPGPGEGRRRHLEGPDRQRQRDGDQPDRPGPQHRRSDHRRGSRRLVEEDHRRGERRNPRAQEHHQHDGRPAQWLRVAK